LQAIECGIGAVPHGPRITSGFAPEVRSGTGSQRTTGLRPPSSVAKKSAFRVYVSASHPVNPVACAASHSCLSRRPVRHSPKRGGGSLIRRLMSKSSLKRDGTVFFPPFPAKIPSRRFNYSQRSTKNQQKKDALRSPNCRQPSGLPAIHRDQFPEYLP